MLLNAVCSLKPFHVGNILKSVSVRQHYNLDQHATTYIINATFLCNI